MDKTEWGRVRQKGGGKGYARAERGRRGSGAGAAGERSEVAAHAPRRRRPSEARAEPAQGAGQGRAEHGSRTSEARSATVRREDDGGKPTAAPQRRFPTEAGRGKGEGGKCKQGANGNVEGEWQTKRHPLRAHTDGVKIPASGGQGKCFQTPCAHTENRRPRFRGRP